MATTTIPLDDGSGDNIYFTYSSNTGTWTRSELEDARIRVYAKRGQTGTTSNYYLNFYVASFYVFWK